MKTILMIIALFATSMIQAQGSMEHFSERLREHTVTIDARTHLDPLFARDAAYAFVMRRLFETIKLGKTYGLPDADVIEIRETSRPDGRAVVTPYFDQLERRMNETDEVVELAGLLEDANRAEQRANAAFYRVAVAKLSTEGKDAIAKAYDAEIETVQIKETQFTAIAADAPDETLIFLRQVLKNAKRLEKNSGGLSIGGEQ